MWISDRPRTERATLNTTRTPFESGSIAHHQRTQRERKKQKSEEFKLDVTKYA
jgi:hypothetical protein